MICSRCRIEKPDIEFNPFARQIGRGYCHLCDAGRKQSDRMKNPKRYILKRVQASAKRRGLDFDLTEQDIPEIPDFCPVFPWLRLAYDVGKGPVKPYTATLDRLDSEKGYIVGNIRFISHAANLFKSDMTKEQLLSFVQGLQKYIEEMPG